MSRATVVILPVLRTFAFQLPELSGLTCCKRDLFKAVFCHLGNYFSIDLITRARVQSLSTSQILMTYS